MTALVCRQRGGAGRAGSPPPLKSATVNTVNTTSVLRPAFLANPDDHELLGFIELKDRYLAASSRPLSRGAMQTSWGVDTDDVSRCIQAASTVLYHPSKCPPSAGDFFRFRLLGLTSATHCVIMHSFISASSENVPSTAAILLLLASQAH